MKNLTVFVWFCFTVVLTLIKKATFTKWRCLIHFKWKSDWCEVAPLTFAKVSKYCQNWVDLDGERRKIAANVAKCIKHLQVARFGKWASARGNCKSAIKQSRESREKNEEKGSDVWSIQSRWTGHPSAIYQHLHPFAYHRGHWLAVVKQFSNRTDTSFQNGA